MGCGSSTAVVEEGVKGKVVPAKATRGDTPESKVAVAATHENQFEKIDAYARKAPSSLKNSVEDLVNYMMSFSKDPKTLARGFFVWISENIRYDVDGYFGRAAMAPHDALGVMKGGSSVCEGYANVMEALCKQANITVKKISGYAKGFSHSATKPFNYSDNTNHAWNAIQIEGKWHLLDTTWGTGHVDKSNQFKKKIEDFYFLTDPKHFISTHFPYMDQNVEESQKWQLLGKPISLEEFSNTVKYEPGAFRLGVKAVSHTRQYFEMKNETQMIFKCTTKEGVVFMGSLMLQDGNFWQEQRNATFGIPDNGSYKLCVHPPEEGLYKLNIFGHKTSDRKQEEIRHVMEYTIKCTSVKEPDFEYPTSYGEVGSEKVVLHEPLRGNLRANTSVKFKISAPYLQIIEVGQTYLEKSGNTFTGEVKTGLAGTSLTAYGTRGDKYTRMAGLFGFSVY